MHIHQTYFCTLRLDFGISDDEEDEDDDDVDDDDAGGLRRQVVGRGEWPVGVA